MKKNYPFKKVFFEENLREHPRWKFISEKLSHLEQYPIDEYENYFGRFHKNYLKKRKELNLFVASKKGQKVKEAPEAYGSKNSSHYYFIHSYNCIYECEYCYLQGYFNSPDIVLFINHEDIALEIKKIYQEKASPENTIYFHAGEFSDSLALSSLSQEIPYYFSLFQELPHASLELRTKSTQIQTLLECKKIPSNVFVSFSISDQKSSLDFDHKTPSFEARLRALKKLQEKGYRIALHLDPLIYHPKLLENLDKCIERLCEELKISEIEYLSLGVVRFSSKVFKRFKSHYPDSKMLHPDLFEKSFDEKYRYNKPLRSQLLQNVKALLLRHSFSERQIYLCMEENA